MVTTPRSSVSTWVWPRPWSPASTVTSWASMTTLHTSICHLITSRSGVSAVHHHPLKPSTIDYQQIIILDYLEPIDLNFTQHPLATFYSYNSSPFSFSALPGSSRQISASLFIQHKGEVGNISMDTAGRYITIMWEPRVGNAIDVALQGTSKTISNSQQF